MKNVELPVQINTYLAETKNYLVQQEWELAIVACQKMIELCQQQISTSQSQSLAPESLLHQGDLLLQQENLLAAMTYYRQALTLNANLPEVYQRLAEIASKQGNWQQATAYYRQAIKSERSPNEALDLSKGELLRSQNRISEAIEFYLQAIKLKPNSADLFANLGSLYAQQQQWQGAIASYQQALQLKPNFAGVYRNLGRVFLQINQLQLAAQYWEKALKLEPNQATLTEYLDLANRFQERKNWQRAIALYQRAIKFKPDSQAAYLQLSQCLNNFSQPEQAITIYRRLIQQYPRQPEPLIYLGIVFSSQKNWTKASLVYQQAIKIQPNFWQAYLYLAEVKLKQSEWQKAFEICHQALKIKSDLSWLYHNLGYAAFKLEDWQQAEQALVQAIKLNSNFTWSYFYLGETLLAQGELEKAVGAYLSAIELDRSLPGVYQRLGIALDRQFQLGLQIVNQYQSPLSTKNYHASFYAQLAASLVAEKQFNAATICYRSAIALEPLRLDLKQQLQQVQQQQAELETEINHLTQQITAKPQIPEPYTQLGNLKADLGQEQQAYQLHRQASVLRGWHLASETRNYRFKYDWFTHNIPVWKQHLEQLNQIEAIHVLEIGCFEGMATCWLLDHILTKKQDHITCIDLYFQTNFEYNLAQTEVKNRITQIEGNSHQVLPTLASNSYDLIYIDGSHLADDVQQDALLAWNLLKQQGLIIFDDYEFTIPENPQQEPKIGIDKFLAAKSSQLQIIHRGYQLIIQRID